jgi:hypothetical protein
VEVRLKSGDVILVGMSEQETINVQTALLVALQAAAQIRYDIWCVVIFVIGSFADVHVDQHRLIVVELQQGHVTVVDGEESD